MIELRPESAAAHFNRGLSKSALCKHKAAIEDYNRAIDIDPQDSSSYRFRGKSKSALGEHEAAIEDYDQAIKRHPEPVAAYFNRSRSKSALGRHEAAIKDYGQVLELDPEYNLAYVNRAEEKILIDEFESAHQDANRAINLSESPKDLAAGLLLYLISGIMSGKNVQDEIEEYTNICEEEFITEWNFNQLDYWVMMSDIDNSTRNKIQNLIKQLREHKS